MELISYVARRLALIIPTLLGASLVMFVLTMLIPGDPALMRLGNFATAEQPRVCARRWASLSRRMSAMCSTWAASCGAIWGAPGVQAIWCWTICRRVCP